MSKNINSKNMRAMIIKAYNKDARVASDDKLLLSRVWAMSGWSKEKTLLQNLRDCPNAETVRRTRAKLVQEGIIKPTAEATEGRYRAFKKVREALDYEY